MKIFKNLSSPTIERYFFILEKSKRFVTCYQIEKIGEKWSSRIVKYEKSDLSNPKYFSIVGDIDLTSSILESLKQEIC